MNFNTKKFQTKQKKTFSLMNWHKRLSKDKFLIFFTENLVNLLSANINLNRALKIIDQQIQDEYYKSIINEIIISVEKGVTLSIALNKHSQIFDEIYVNLIKNGEVSGKMEIILRKHLEYLKSIQYLNKKIKLAMIYPGIILSVSFIVIIFFIMFIIPVFQDIYENLNTQLPASTLFLLSINKHYQYILVFIGLLIIGGFYLSRSRHILKLFLTKIDELSIKIPVYGTYKRKIVYSRLFRTLGTLVSAGIPLADAMKNSGKIIKYKRIKFLLDNAVKDLEKGIAFTNSLRRTELFSSVIIQMIATGEEAVILDKTLLQVADIMDEELKDVSDVMISILDPLLIIIIGIVIMFLLITLYMPLFDVVSNINV